MLCRCISLLLLLATRGAHTTGNSGEAATRGFVEAVHNGAADQMAFVLDVGANNGAWSRSIMGRVRPRLAPGLKAAGEGGGRSGGAVRVQPILFEPQQVFRKPLQRLLHHDPELHAFFGKVNPTHERACAAHHQELTHYTPHTPLL